MIPEIIRRLQGIAKKNGDEFQYKIELEPTVRGLRYTFVCEETADGHVFVDGGGFTLDLAIQDAEGGISGACSSWGYKE